MPGTRSHWFGLRNSVAQLMNKRPSDVASKEKDPVVDRVQQALEGLDWVDRARVRLREDGDVITGEAFVVPRDGQSLSDRELRRHVVARLPRYMIPARMEIIRELPRTSTGKIDRRRLAQEAASGSLG